VREDDPNHGKELDAVEDLNRVTGGTLRVKDLVEILSDGKGQ